MMKRAVLAICISLVLFPFLAVPSARQPSMNRHQREQALTTRQFIFPEAHTSPVAVPDVMGCTGADVSLGTLVYIPPPDVTICFCGSYHLVGEEGFESYYLLPGTLDLTPYIGQKVMVQGRAFTGICQGTLALPCEYLAVEKITTQSRWGTTESNWGEIKKIYR